MDQTEMPMVVLVNAKIFADRLEEFKPIITNSAIEGRKEPGCLRFDVCIDKEDPTKMVFYEVYKNAEAFEFHKTTQPFKNWEAFNASKGVESVTAQIMDGFSFEN